jgi:two-component system, chemotaxis family, response regulator Rcp1
MSPTHTTTSLGADRRNDPRLILLVEDHPGDAQLAQDAFLEAGFTVQIQVVASGEEALAYLRRLGAYRESPRPDLIICDLKLPLMSGYDLLSTLKVDDDFRRIPTIVFSGNDSPEVVARCYDLSVSTYVAKPSDWSQYVEQIKVIATYWFTVARLPAA